MTTSKAKTDFFTREAAEKYDERNRKLAPVSECLRAAGLDARCELVHGYIEHFWNQVGESISYT